MTRTASHTNRRARRASARWVTATIATIAALGSMVVPVPQAGADSDPASDVLFSNNAFFPYAPAVSPQVEHRLLSVLAQLKSDRYPIRVAIIASTGDMGGIVALYDKPQTYANFLSNELQTFYARLPPSEAQLLVVMPDGLGLAYSGSPGDTTPLAGLKASPAPNLSDALAEEATLAVERLAAAAGHRVAPATSSPGHGSGVPWVAVLAAAAAVAAVLAGVWLRRRRVTHTMTAEHAETTD